SVSCFFPQEPMVREGAGAGRISGVLLSDNQPHPEYRQAGAGAYDRASCGDPVLCHIPDRKNSGAAGGTREHDHHFLSHPETGENGPEAVPYVYRDRAWRKFRVFPWFPDRNAAVRLAVLRRSVRICKRNDNSGQYKPDPWGVVGFFFYRGVDFTRDKLAADLADLPSGADRMPGPYLYGTERHHGI